VVVAWTTHVDGNARQLVDYFPHIVASDGGEHDALDILDVESILATGHAVDVHIDVAPAGQALGQCRGAARALIII
jgi:hypothetical protein